MQFKINNYIYCTVLFLYKLYFAVDNLLFINPYAGAINENPIITNTTIEKLFSTAGILPKNILQELLVLPIIFHHIYQTLQISYIP